VELAARVYFEAAGRTGSAKTIWRRTAIFRLTVRLERRSRIPRGGEPGSDQYVFDFMGRNVDSSE
jgi:hypothetical protein